MELMGVIGLAAVPSVVCLLCCRCRSTPVQPPSLPRTMITQSLPSPVINPHSCYKTEQEDISDVLTVKVEVHSSSSGAGSDEMSSSDISDRGSGSGAGGDHDYEDIYLVRAEAGAGGAPRSRSRDSGSHSRSASISSTHSNIIVHGLPDEPHINETPHVHHNDSVRKPEPTETKHCDEQSHKNKQKLNHSHSMPYHAANSRALKRVVSEPGAALPPPPPPPPLEDLSLSSPDNSLPPISNKGEPQRADSQSSHSSQDNTSVEENSTARASSVSPSKPDSPEPHVTEAAESPAAEETHATAGPNLVNKQMVLPFIPPKFPSSDGDEHSLIKPSEYLRALGNKGNSHNHNHTATASPPPPPQPQPQLLPPQPLPQSAKVVEVHPHPQPQAPVPVHSFQGEDKTGSVLSVSVGPPPPPLPEPVSPPPPPANATRKADQPLGTISIQDLNSVQLRRTNKTLTKTMSAPPASLTVPTEAPMQVVKHDLIEELKKSKDITGIKKMKVEKVKMEEQHEKELVTEIHKQLSVDSFVEKIPEKDITGNPIPPWKRQMLAKKAAEKARKEMEEALARQAEEKRIQAIPPWKRQLMQAKKPEEKVSNGTIITPAVEEKKLTPMPTVQIIENSPAKENKENNKPVNKEPTAATVTVVSKDDTAPIIPWRAQLRKTNSTLNLLE